MAFTAPQNRIQHVIVLALENRSFDHIFGFFQPAAQQNIENLLADSTQKFNLLDPSRPEAQDNPRFPASHPAPFAVHDKEGPSHSFNAVNVQLCNNKAGPSAANLATGNGFVRSYKDDLLRRTHEVDADHIAEVMESFSPDQLPTINQLAREFCLCDHWHCDVPGPTMPNRMFLHAATSEGYVHNNFKRAYTSKTVYELLAEKGFTWATYFHDLNEVLQFGNLVQTPPNAQTADHFRRFDERWVADVSQGNLPNYTFILPRFMNKRAGHGSVAKFANSQHAPEDVRFGEHLIADIYDALASNEDLWNKSALIVTYDEHGGLYDHVVPGATISPDGQDSPNPDDDATFTVPSFAFDRLGLRVPAVIASPWIPKGTIEHEVLQHASVIKTVTELFGLNGPLNERDRSAASVAELFTRLDSPRSKEDMPTNLDRPPLDNTLLSFVADIPVDPADEPLDSLTEEWVQGIAALTQERMGLNQLDAESVELLPTTQGDAADFVERRLKEVFGI